ncbi:hypothetical protein [Geodermatophilus poikilotrophus]|uniref:hypothetical protein n=1 Tax=Geodermatophilus poikilotrophus TaxID=1333667 RepID=UPI0015877D9C|nr:hypothetical protein [Geodermatophilus poikilotrophus]
MSTRTIPTTAPRALTLRWGSLPLAGDGEEGAPARERASSRSTTAALVTLPRSASEEEA